MTKPQDYRQERVVTCATSYEVHEGAQKGPHAGSGVLNAGRVVWVKEAPEPAVEQVSAYAEGIGVISLRSGSLHG